jgi:hypothetical protein
MYRGGRGGGPWGAGTGQGRVGGAAWRGTGRQGGRVAGWVRARGGFGRGAGSGWGRQRRAGVEFGINGGSPGKDGVTTKGNHALVFSELRQVICGLAVYTAVHNHRDVRITGGILWTTCGHEKTQNEFRRALA